MTKKILKVALLVADTPNEKVVAVYGAYPAIFTRLLGRAIEEEGQAAEVQLELEPFDVVNSMQYPEHPEHFDAVLITGSAASAYENAPWIVKLTEYTRELPSRAPQTRLVGVCFGHQIIARAFGGTVERNPLGWELGWTEINMTDAGAKLLGVDDSKLVASIERLRHPTLVANDPIMSPIHVNDHVSVTPPDFEVLGSTDICPNQFMRKSQQIFSVQAHPEFTPDILRIIIGVRRASGVFSPEFADTSLGKLDRKADSDHVVRCIVRFMLNQLSDA